MLPQQKPLLKDRRASIGSTSSLSAFSTSSKPLENVTSLKYESRSLQIWLKVCSYATCHIYITLVAVLLTTGLGVEYWMIIVESNNSWYDNLGEGAWVISTYMTFFVVHRNLKKFNPFYFIIITI